MTISAGVLGPTASRKSLRLREIVEERELAWRPDKDGLLASFEIEPGETLVLEVLPGASQR
jgi:hypothetical protein